MAPSQSPPLVDNAQIKHAELLTPLSLQYHAYVWPFAIVWPVFLRFYLDPKLYDTYIQAPEWTFVWIVTIVTFQSLVWLCTHWSVDLKGIFTAKKVQSVDDAKLIKVIPVANAGVSEICTILRDQVRAAPLPLLMPDPRSHRTCNLTCPRSFL